MKLLLALTLIFSAFANIFVLRRRSKRLNVFDKVEIKNISLSILAENQLTQQKQTFWQYIIFSIRIAISSNFNLLIVGQSKLTLFAYIAAGLVVGLIFNSYYLGYSVYLAMTFSLMITIFAIIYLKKRKLTKEFYDNFPEALSTIAGVVSSGYPITTSFKNCGETINGAVGSTMREVNNG